MVNLNDYIKLYRRDLRRLCQPEKPIDKVIVEAYLEILRATTTDNC